MRNQALKWAVIGGVLVAVLMFGIEMSGSGIERVYGPVEGDTSVSVTRYAVDPAVLAREKAAAEYEKALLDLQKKFGVVSKDSQQDGSGAGLNADPAAGPITTSGNERLPGLPNTSEDTGVNRFADTAADLLQAASSSGIHFIVGLFDSVTK